MKRLLHSGLFLLLSLVLMLGMTAPALAADTAATMKLSQTEGTVSVCNAAGRNMPLRDDMRLYNGYIIETGAKSYAWINLDDTKLVKMDASSKVEVRKSGKQLEVFLHSGGLCGDISKKLESDETMNVRTSTSIAGIRGTFFETTVMRPPADPSNNRLKVSNQTLKPVVVPDRVNLIIGSLEISRVAIGVNKGGPAILDSEKTNILPGTIFLDESGAQSLKLGDISGFALKELVRSGSGSVTIQTPDGPITVTPEYAEQRLKEDEAKAAAQAPAAPPAENKIVFDPEWSSQPQGSQSGSSTGSGRRPNTGSGSRPSTDEDPKPPAIYHTVTFDSMGGSAVASISVPDGALFTLSDVSVKPGYRFTGWFLDEACTQPWQDGTRITADLTLYAGWEADGEQSDTLTVIFDSQGGSPVEGQTVPANSLLTEPAAPVRAGYIFGGWFMDAACTQQWHFASSTGMGEITLYAKWTVSGPGGEPAELQVTFDSMCEVVVAPQMVPYGGRVTRPAGLDRPGYVLTGWYKDEQCTQEWDFESDIVTSELVLYAGWKDEGGTVMVTVAFDSQGGSVVDSRYALTGSLLTVPDAPTKEKHEFDGWYKDEQCTQAWDFDSDVVSGDMTLYAKWVAVYRVSFDSQGGSAVDIQSVRDGEHAVKPSDPYHLGKGFGGWYKDAACTQAWDFSVDTVTADMTLYAKWVQRYTVFFDSQGGSAVAEQTVLEGSLVTEPTDPTRENYFFLGWYKDADCTVKWKFKTDTVTAETRLYAGWEYRTGRVIFVVESGQIVDAPTETVPFGEKVPRPEDPVRDGYVFCGWFETEGYFKEFDFDAPLYEDRVLVYAKWVSVDTTFNVYYYIGNGTFTPPESHLVGELLPRPADPVQEGYDFGGWYLDSDCLTTPWDFDVDRILDTVTLYPKWTKKAYTVTFDSQGGPAVASQQVEHGGKVSQPADEVYEDHIFGGWYRDSQCTTSWDFAQDTVTEDITLYAKWIEVYHIVFARVHPDGTPLDPAMETRDTNAEGKLDTVSMPVPSLDDTADAYFLGWNTGTQAAGDYSVIDFDTYQFTADTQLVPVWREKFTVTFHYNNDSGTTVTKTINRDGFLDEIPEMSSEKWEEYDFLGWNVDPDGDPGDTGEWNAAASDPFTSNQDLYAMWDFKVIPSSNNIYADLTDLLQTRSAIQLDGTFDLESDGSTLTISADKKLIIASGATLNVGTAGKDGKIQVAAGGTLINDGTINIGSSNSSGGCWIMNEGTITNNGTYNGSAVSGTGTIDGAQASQMTNGNP
ncbi:MAG: hypothetical protein HFH26_00275 [Clostridiaceae bacterium]|nr:hypothetical protein [Clostridiaceae bacterium]